MSRISEEKNSNLIIDGIEHRSVWAVKDAGVSQGNDFITVEEPLQLRIKQHGETFDFSMTMRTPGADREMVLGYLFSEGIIEEASDVEFLESDDDNVVYVGVANRKPIKSLRRRTYTSSSCGVCSKTSIEQLEVKINFQPIPKYPTVSHEVLLSLSAKAKGSQEIFSKTGGIHSATLFDPMGNLLFSFEDVGRHNAMDKLVGNALDMAQIPLNNHLIFFSGRTSFELVQKALMAGISIIVSVGAPSTMAIDLANKFEATLIGFSRNNSYNIYSGRERIQL